MPTAPCDSRLGGCLLFIVGPNHISRDDRPGWSYENRVVTTGRHSRRGERQARQRARRERRAVGVWVWPQAAQEGWRRGPFETPIRFATGSSG